MKYLANTASIELMNDRCSGCGVCLDVCPHNVLSRDGNKVMIADRDACMECGACENNCAFGAISVQKGVGCAAALINSMITGGDPSCDCSNEKGNCC